MTHAAARPLPFSDYAALPGVNWSTLKHLARSPLHYQQELRAAPTKNDDLHYRIGRATHTSVFEPRRFPLEYVVYTESKSRGKGARKRWQEYQGANSDKTILSSEQYDLALALGDAVRTHPVAARYLRTGIGEHALTWTDAETGIACKGRIDWISTSEPALCDLKTDRDGDPRRIRNVFARLLYHAQIAFYVDGWQAAHGETLDPIFFVVEKEPPFDVGVFRMHADFLDAGRDEYRRLLGVLAECRNKNEWPGRYPYLEELSAPDWMNDKAGDLFITEESGDALQETV